MSKKRESPANLNGIFLITSQSDSPLSLYQAVFPGKMAVMRSTIMPSYFLQAGFQSECSFSLVTFIRRSCSKWPPERMRSNLRNFFHKPESLFMQTRMTAPAQILSARNSPVFTHFSCVSTSRTHFMLFFALAGMCSLVGRLCMSFFIGNKDCLREKHLSRQDDEEELLNASLSLFHCPKLFS